MLLLLHPDETNRESSTGNPVQLKEEHTADEGATENQTAQPPTPAANSYDHHHGK